MVRVSRRGFIQTISGAVAALGIQRRSLFAQPAGASIPAHTKAAPELSLWFAQPASQWVDALPVGNGRLGAMVYGGVTDELIALNEDTLWSGFPRDWNNPGAREALPDVRKMVLQDADYHGADQECRKMQGPFNQAYEPLGELAVHFDHRDEPVNYARSLDLDSASAHVKYEVAGIRYTREVFVSASDPIIAVRFMASKPGSLGGTLKLSSKLQSQAKASSDYEIQLTGRAPSESVPAYLESKDPIQYSTEPGKGMHFAAVLHAYAQGGKLAETEDGTLTFLNVTSLIVYIGAATGYRAYDVAPDTPITEVVTKAAGRSAPYRRHNMKSFGAVIWKSTGSSFAGAACDSVLRRLRIYCRRIIVSRSFREARALPCLPFTSITAVTFSSQVPDPAANPRIFRAYGMASFARPGVRTGLPTSMSR